MESGPSMSSAATAIRPNRAFGLFDATIIKKAIVALTGAILFAFLVGHLLGNLQVFAGDHGKKMDDYARFLKSMPELLWTTRITLLVALTLHIVCTVQLWNLKNAARSVAYVKKDNSHSSLASRTMYYSGPMIFFFVVYHLLHFTWGVAQPSLFADGQVYRNVVVGFQQPLIAIVYVIAMGLLCLHLNHGLFSMWQTLGVNHPKYTPWFKKGAAAISILMFLGFSSIPAGVIAGIVAL